MSGLSGKAASFMAKKGYNPWTMKNKEKVWSVEKEVEEQKKKNEERLKIIEDERSIELIKKLKSNYVERVDFLYSVPPNLNQQYMEGRRYQGPDETDVDRVRDKPGSLWLDGPINFINDKITKIREDPLLSIKQEKQKYVEKIKDNPVKMKELKKKSKKKDKEKKKKMKDDKKKKRKSKRKRSKSRDGERRKRRRKNVSRERRKSTSRGRSNTRYSAVEDKSM